MYTNELEHLFPFKGIETGKKGLSLKYALSCGSSSGQHHYQP